MPWFGPNCYDRPIRLLYAMSQKMPICKSDPRHLDQPTLKRRVQWAGRVAFGVLVRLQSGLTHGGFQ